VKKRLATSTVALMLMQCLTNCATASNVPTPDDWDARIKEGVAAYKHNQFEEGEKIFNRLMNEGARKFGAFDGRMGRIYSNLGECYNGEGNFYYGTVYLKRALDVREKAYGANSFELAPSLNGLALALVGQHKYSEAEPYYRRALSVSQAAGQKGLAYVGIVECNLGSMYYNEGKYKEAEPHLKKGLPIIDQLYGSENDLTLTTARMYATCLRNMGKESEGKSIEEAAVARAREVSSPATQWEKCFYKAQSLADAKNYAESENTYTQALQWAENLPDQIPLIVTLYRYAKVCTLDNKPVEALTLMRRAQPLSEKQLGLDDPQVMKHSLELADMELQQGRYADAEPLYLKVVVYQKKQFGADSPQMRDTLGKLAKCYSSSGQYDKASKVLERALVADEKNYGATDPRLEPTLVVLANAYRGDLQFDKSEAAYKRAVSILEHSSNKKQQNPELASLLEQFSLVYQKRSIWEKAEPLLTRAVALREKAPGDANVDLINTLQSYANMLRAASMRDRAEPVEERIAHLKSSSPKAEAMPTTASTGTTAKQTAEPTELEKALQ
jgi:tetratricopeptide (TPR) repeat protein